MALEIERRWLLRTTPSTALLFANGAKPLRIEQTYLLPTREAPVRRARKVDDGQHITYVYTTKRSGSGLVRIESEREVGEETFRQLLREADPVRQKILKTRWVAPLGTLHLEIDVFEKPDGMAIVEVELPQEHTPVTLPAWLDVEREVTREAKFGNYEMAVRGWRPYDR